MLVVHETESSWFKSMNLLLEEATAVTGLHASLLRSALGRERSVRVDHLKQICLDGGLSIVCIGLVLN